jgi:uncharacterized protein involved in exopolysaccharide biosynthesis
LNKDIIDVNTEIERLKLQKTGGLQAKIDDAKAEINSLCLEKGFVQNIKVIQNPEVSLSPIKPKKKRNVLLAGVVGFTILIFFSFFLEYLQKSQKDREKSV